LKSLERIFNTLVSLGLTRTEAEIYVLLTRKGPQKKDDIANLLNVVNQDLHQSLIELRENGFINLQFKQSSIFIAVPFEKALENLIEIKSKEAQVAQENKKAVLRYWDSMLKESEKNK
jgi:sugar-specific transcriptional regulator TrmB